MDDGAQLLSSCICRPESQPREWRRSQRTGFSISVKPTKIILHKHAYSHVPGHPGPLTIEIPSQIAVFMLVYSFGGLVLAQYF